MKPNKRYIIERNCVQERKRQTENKDEDKEDGEERRN